MCVGIGRHSSFYFPPRSSTAHTTSVWIINKRMSHVFFGFVCGWEGFCVYREVMSSFSGEMIYLEWKMSCRNLVITTFHYVPVVGWMWSDCGVACDGRTIRREVRTSTDTANLLKSRKILLLSGLNFLSLVNDPCGRVSSHSESFSNWVVCYPIPTRITIGKSPWKTTKKGASQRDWLLFGSRL